MPEGCWGLRCEVELISGHLQVSRDCDRNRRALRGEEDRPLGGSLAAAAEKETARPHDDEGTSARTGSSPQRAICVRIVDLAQLAGAAGRGTARVSCVDDGVLVERVDVADEAAMKTLHDVFRLAHAVDAPDDPVPTFPEILAQARATQASTRREFWLARSAGVPVAAC